MLASEQSSDRSIKIVEAMFKDNEEFLKQRGAIRKKILLMKYRKYHIKFWCFVVSGLGATAVYADDPLANSLTFLDPVSKPMPDFRRVPFYKGLPVSDGSIVAGLGHSGRVEEWFRQMERTIPTFLKLDDKLATDVGVYADTVKEEGRKVIDAKRTAFGPSLERLDDSTDSKVSSLLREYRNAVQMVNNARKQHEATQLEVEKATFGLSASKADEKECFLLLAKANLETERAAIERKLKQGREFLDAANEAISAMAGGPRAVESYLGAKTVGAAKTVFGEIVYAAEHRQLTEIGVRIDAIDKALKEDKCQAHKLKLEGARRELQAKMRMLVLGFGKILQHRANAWGIIDELGRLEKGKQTSTFFQRLQSYNAQVNKMGATVFSAVVAYQEFLSKAPVSRGDFVHTLVLDDIQFVETEKRDRSGQWTVGAKNVKDYLSEYSHWYHGETIRTGKILEDLRAGKHLHFVDTMISEASDDLGATVDPQDIIR
jgi:hypothetical protein